jgi:hypothetical protein
MLAGQHIIAVNDSYKCVPFADAVISIDGTWIASRSADLRSFAGRKYIAARVGVPIPAFAERLTLRTEPGLSEVWPIVHGTTSGRAALNLAALLGYRRIKLLGFDYRNPGQHHHAVYEWPSGAPENVWQQWAEEYGTCVPQLRKLGVEVLNCGNDSAINAFPIVRLEDLI